MSGLTLQSDVSERGMNQGDLVKVLRNILEVVNELQTDHETTKAVVDKLVHKSKNFFVSVDPALAINTNFDVKNTETTLFVAGGLLYTLADNTVADTGTSKVLTGAKWGAFAVEASTATALAATWVTGEYASEALALAAVKAMAPTADKCVIGYVTVLAHASGFTAGTDALTTGTGGNVATTTSYYNMGSPLFTAGPDTLTASTALKLTGG